MTEKKNTHKRRKTSNFKRSRTRRGENHIGKARYLPCNVLQVEEEI